VAHNRPDDHRLIGDRHRDRHMDGSLTRNIRAKREWCGTQGVASVAGLLVWHLCGHNRRVGWDRLLKYQADRSRASGDK
jgi:hypothetical protein